MDSQVQAIGEDLYFTKLRQLRNWTYVVVVLKGLGILATGYSLVQTLTFDVAKITDQLKQSNAPQDVINAQVEAIQLAKSPLMLAISIALVLGAAVVTYLYINNIRQLKAGLVPNINASVSDYVLTGLNILTSLLMITMQPGMSLLSPYTVFVILPGLIPLIWITVIFMKIKRLTGVEVIDVNAPDDHDLPTEATKDKE